MDASTAWLIHHVLSRADYNPPNLAFPVSVPMLRPIAEYNDVLTSYSRDVLPWWSGARRNSTTSRS